MKSNEIYILYNCVQVIYKKHAEPCKTCLFFVFSERLHGFGSGRFGVVEFFHQVALCLLQRSRHLTVKNDEKFWNGRKHNSNSQQLRKLKQTEELRKQTVSTCFNGLLSSTVLLTKGDCKMLQDISSKILPAALLKYLARYLEGTFSPSFTS